MVQTVPSVGQCAFVEPQWIGDCDTVMCKALEGAATLFFDRVSVC